MKSHWFDLFLLMFVGLGLFLAELIGVLQHDAAIITAGFK